MICSEIRFVSPRDTIEVHLPDGRAIQGPRGEKVSKFLEALDNPGSPPIVGAVVNGELRELTYAINIDAYIRPVTMEEADGMRFYRRSLTFLLESAFNELFPGNVLTIDHSVFSGGYFCNVSGRPPLTKKELSRLEKRMRELSEADIPLTRQRVPLAEAIQYFKEHGYDDKVQLLANRKKDYLILYSMGEHRDYHHGYMVPSTGYLKWFALTPTDHGFTLQFPRRHRPTELLPPPSYPKLLATFTQYGNWLERLGINHVGALNEAIEASRTREVILVSEALHEQQISDVASKILSHYRQVRIIIIAGPSASGKTTFSKRLSIQLLARGISPFPLEMDNYFVEREKTPKDAEGERDYEAIEALDLKLLSKDVKKLIAGEEVQLPKYNFFTGAREPGEVIRLEPDQLIILEGIHGMNTNLLPGIQPEKSLRIYTSALTQLNLDRHNRISTTDTRLIRRIVRDTYQRGYSATETIQRWESVHRGEKRNIFPFQENADLMFNSALVYELSALKSFAEPLLRQVQHGTPEYLEAKRLLSFLEWFLPIESDLIPDNSILREFIGNSILQHFKVWKSD
ncbi:MAG: nucleoside kinase [Chloroflexota bacterium]